MRWSRTPPTPKPCYCTSPNGFWCTRTGRHAQHEAAGGSGQVFARWHGDFPSESELLDSFTNEDGFRKAVGNDRIAELTAVDHNDLLRGID